MQTILVVFHMMLSIGLVGLILIQHGKGADMGAAFGSGASATVFGARGSGSFLSRTTAVLATLFFVTSMALAYFASQVTAPAGVMDSVAPPRIEEPAAPESEVPLPPGSQAPLQSEVPVPRQSAVPLPAEQAAPEAPAAAAEASPPARSGAEDSEETVAKPAEGTGGEQPAR